MNVGAFMKQETINRIRKFTTDRDWDKYHTPNALAKTIAIESTELLECFQWNENAKIEKVKEELGDAGFLPYFQVIIGGDMVERSKPEPDIFLKACEELSVSPKDTYIIEDSYNGIRAAYAAGAMPIMVPDILMPDDEMKEKTHVILPDLMSVKKFFEE